MSRRREDAVAIVGADGHMGQEVLRSLADRSQADVLLSDSVAPDPIATAARFDATLHDPSVVLASRPEVRA